MSKYKAAIFDVDGTILNTTEGVVAAVKHTIEKKRLPELSYDELLTFIGPPIQDSFSRIYGFEEDMIQELANIFREFYKGPDLFKAKPYDGIFELWDELKDRNIKIAVATYKRQDYALDILKHFGFDKYSDAIFGADNQNILKKVDIIQKCLEKLNVMDYREAVMIGDSWHDENGASMLGIDFVGVTYGFGFRTKEDIKGKCSVGGADTPMDILKFFD